MKFLEWIQKWNKGKKPQKTDWVILILVGVLLMVVVWPTGSSDYDTGDAGNGTGSSLDSGAGNSMGSDVSDGGNTDGSTGSSAVAIDGNEYSGSSVNGSNGENTSASDSDEASDAVVSDAVATYTAALEEELAEILSSMSGVGEVRVMITLSDNGETILQQDSSKSSDTSSNSTVILEQGDDELPYIISRVVPSVQGVVVVAQGAGSGNISTEITEAVIALFGIEAHKVKVLQME